MGPDELVFLVPIVAIVMVFLRKMMKDKQNHELSLAQIRSLQQSASSSSPNDFESLRRELAALRDTTTQYDLSIQHLLENLETRIAAVESKVASVCPDKPGQACR